MCRPMRRWTGMFAAVAKPASTLTTRAPSAIHRYRPDTEDHHLRHQRCPAAVVHHPFAHWRARDVAARLPGLGAAIQHQSRIVALVAGARGVRESGPFAGHIAEAVLPVKTM